MKFLLSSLIITVFYLPSYSFALFCLSSESNYQVFLEDNEHTAEAFKGLQPVKFGRLVCSRPNVNGESGAALFCKSANVADAGFTARFLANSEGKIESVELKELFLAGAKHLATLPCLDSVGTPHKRVLWLTGDSSLSPIEITPDGDIEINIKTDFKSGEQWRLEEPFSKDSVHLVGEPVMTIPDETHSEFGVTKFSFKVNRLAKENFSIELTLFRRGQEAALKKMSVYLKLILSSPAEDLGFGDAVVQREIENFSL